MAVPKIRITAVIGGPHRGVLLGGPHNKDYRIWGLYWSPSISDNEYIIPRSSLVNISPCSLRTLHLKPFNMSYSLNSLRGGGLYKKIYGGLLQGLLKGILGV